MLQFIWSLIIGGILGAVAGKVMGKNLPAGILGNILFGFLGSWVGSKLLGGWGPQLAGFAIVPALLGAILCVAVFSFFFSKSSS